MLASVLEAEFDGQFGSTRGFGGVRARALCCAQSPYPSRSGARQEAGFGRKRERFIRRSPVRVQAEEPRVSGLAAGLGPFRFRRCDKDVPIDAAARRLRLLVRAARRLHRKQPRRPREHLGTWRIDEFRHFLVLVQGLTRRALPRQVPEVDLGHEKLLEVDRETPKQAEVDDQAHPHPLGKRDDRCMPVVRGASRKTSAAGTAAAKVAT